MYIHLGDFQFIKENFALMGKLVTGSRFEDVVFMQECVHLGAFKEFWLALIIIELGLYIQLSLKILKGFFYERFLEEYNDTLPQIFSQLTDNTYINIETTIENEKDLFFEYLIFKDNVRSGTLGKTPQFWVQLNMDLMECQTRIHLAV